MLKLINHAAALGLMGLFGSALQALPPCQHSQGRSYIHSGYISPDWTRPRDGRQLFFNTFVNATKAPQQFSQEVSGEIRTELNADLSLSFICLKAGVSETVAIKRVFNVNIPAHTKMSMSAHANMMDKDVGMLVTCSKCREVLSAYHAQLTAARGINEYFKTIN